MKRSSFLVLLFLLVFLVACNMPSNGGQPTATSPENKSTQAAQTVAAILTSVAQDVSPTSNIPSDTPQPSATFAPLPTNTPIWTSTQTPKPCLLVGFNNATIDQTIPDNTVMAPGQTFKKTWRLINLGTCTWTSSYLLAFDRGDAMGVPANYAQTLTSGSVSPNQSVDVSVNLTAPSSAGTYTGYWHFRDPNGINFGIGGNSSWIVKIKVVNSTTVTLPVVAAESGTVRAADPSGVFTDYTIGESNTDITKVVEAFLSFDISGIPHNATITEVKINFSAYTTEGSPFNLGVLNGYIANWGTTLKVADFVPGFPPGNTLDWGSTGALDSVAASPELKAALQAKLGDDRLQLRLQFPGSNNDATKDRLTLTSPTIVITYVTP